MPLPIKIPLSGLAARKAALNSSSSLVEAKPAPKPPSSPEEATDRIGIVFDDSGSMLSHNKIQDAQEGTIEFLRSCNPETTAVSVYPLNAREIKLNVDLPNTALKIKEIHPSGGTPILTTLRKLIETKITRIVLFSDGQPTDIYNSSTSYITASVIELCSSAKEKEIVIDTVYISSATNDSSAEEFLKYLARATGGIFLRFKAGESSFRNSFKYLAPAYRALLADKSFVDKIQSGE